MSTKPPQDELRPATELRRRSAWRAVCDMIADMQRVGMSEERQRMYVRAVRMLAEHYNKPPDQITEEELRRYFLYIKKENWTYERPSGKVKKASKNIATRFNQGYWCIPPIAFKPISTLPSLIQSSNK